MGVTISIDKAGRLVLPKAIREKFHLEGGAQVEVQTVGDHIELSPVVEESPVQLEDKDGWLVVSSGGGDVDIVDAIEADREARDAHIEAEG